MLDLLTRNLFRAMIAPLVLAAPAAAPVKRDVS
jgi:hypothetical protein